MDPLRWKVNEHHDPDLTEAALASLAKPYGLVSHAATKREVEERMPAHELELICCLHLQGVGPRRSQPPAGLVCLREEKGKAERGCKARRCLIIHVLGLWLILLLPGRVTSRCLC